MAVTVEIPRLLQDLTGKGEIAGDGGTLRELLLSLKSQYPALVGRFLKNSEELSNMVNIFVNEVDFHQLSGLDTLLSEGDRVRLAIAPLISGGARP